MKMALAFQLKLQKRLSSYADDVYWLYTHTHSHLQHTYSHSKQGNMHAHVYEYFNLA